MRSLLPTETVTALALACAPAGAQMLDIAPANKEALAELITAER